MRKAANIFKTAPAILSFLVLGAHFLRAGNYGITLMSITRTATGGISGESPSEPVRNK